MIRRAPAIAVLALLAGCAASPPARVPVAEFLAFGDSGYHYDYLEPDDGAGTLTPEAYVAHEREKWIEDKRPIADFDSAPPYRRPDTGGYVNASGQAGVAMAMRRYCTDPAKCEFAVMLGDNIYPAGAMAEVRYLETTRPFYMDGLRYRVAPTGDPREVEIFGLDTHVMLSDHSILKAALDDDGSEIDSGRIEKPEPWALPRDAVEWGQAEWLEEALTSSPARWKIVIGHHPLWSSAGSKFQQARMLRRVILPALCRHADLYLAGHEHTLEVFTDACPGVPEAKGRPPLPEVVSGAAGKQRPPNTNFDRHQLEAHPELQNLFVRGLTWGYAHVTLTRDEATIQLISIPDDGSGTSSVVFEHSFARRSGR